MLHDLLHFLLSVINEREGGREEGGGREARREGWERKRDKPEETLVKEMLCCIPRSLW